MGGLIDQATQYRILRTTFPSDFIRFIQILPQKVVKFKKIKIQFFFTLNLMEFCIKSVVLVDLYIQIFPDTHSDIVAGLHSRNMVSRWLVGI